MGQGETHYANSPQSAARKVQEQKQKSEYTLRRRDFRNGKQLAGLEYVAGRFESTRLCVEVDSEVRAKRVVAIFVWAIMEAAPAQW